MVVITEILNFVSKRSPYSQILIGTATGCLTSFLIMRFCKLAAALAGGAILLIKIAEIEELVYIDWDRTKNKVKNITPTSSTNLINDDLEEITKSPKNFQVAFVGGLLLGVGCS